MKALKRLAVVFGSILGLLIVAAIIVPLVVDVDKYRPQVLQAANQQLNGKLEIGKLSLSLLGRIRVRVDGVELKDSSGKTVVSVKDADFHLPLLSVLSGSPEMIFEMSNPTVNLIKFKNGKLNAMSLMKPSAPAASQPAAPSASASGASQPLKVPAIAASARLGVQMTGAQVSYQDEGTGLKTQIHDLNLLIQNISLSHAMDLKLWADLDTTMGKSLMVKGPAVITAHVKPELAGGVFDHASLDAKVDLDGLDIAAGDAFHKHKGMAANVELAAVVSPSEAKIDHLDVNFFNAELKAGGSITGLSTPSPIVNLTLDSNTVNLKAWNQLVPMLKDFDLAGTAKLDATAQGPSDKLGYKAKFAVQGLTAKAPNLKAEPRVDLAVDVVTDQIQSLLLTVKAPGNALQLKGKLVGFNKPQGVFDVTSSGMDLDQLVKWPPSSPKTQAKAAKPASSGHAPAGAEDVDASLDSLRANPAAAQASIVTNFNIKMLKAQGIVMDDIVGKLYFKNLTAGLDGFAMRIWDGKIKASLAAQLKPKQPTYTYGLLLDGLDLKKAVEANVQAVKNTVVGKLHFDLNGSGSSFNTASAEANAKAKGSFKVENAVFSTVDVTKMATDGITKSLGSVADKVPMLKGKTLSPTSGKESKYDWVQASFTVAGGKFNMPDFATKASPNRGIDLKGNTVVGIQDYSLNAAWDVIDTWDLTGARKLSVNAGGIKADHILAQGNGPVKFTVHAGCTCLQPCYSYTEVPAQLTQVAMGNMVGGSKGAVVNRIQAALPKSVAPAASQALKKLFH